MSYDCYQDMTESKRTPAAVAAHLTSDVFSPLLTPTYGCLVALWLTRMALLPVGIRLWTLLGIAAITALAPAIALLVLMKIGRVSDVSISDKRQRTIPYWISIACYSGACFFLSALKAPMWLIAFYAGAAAASFIAMIITRSWKISAHTTAMAGLAAGIFWLARNGMIIQGAYIWVSLGFLMTGVMAWARLYLRHHTLMQTFAGACLGFFSELIILSIF